MGKGFGVQRGEKETESSERKEGEEKVEVALLAVLDVCLPVLHSSKTRHRSQLAAAAHTLTHTL